MPREPVSRTNKQIIAENEELRARVDEAEETLRAIRSGEVDALIVTGKGGEQVFTFKQVEEALRLSEEKFRTLVEEVNDGFYMTDGNGIFSFANPALARIFGVETPQALLGKKFLDFVAPEIIADLGKEHIYSLVTERIPEIISSQIVRPDGTRAFIEIKPSSLIEAGQVIGSRGVVRDITERKHSEQLMQNFNNASLEAERALSHEDIFNALQRELNKLDFSCMIFMVAEKENIIFLKYLSYPSWLITSAEKLAGITKDEYRLKIDDTTLGQRVVRGQETCFVADVAMELGQILPPRLIKFTGALLKRLNIHQMICAPVIVDGKVIAVFTVQSITLTAKDTSIVAAFANQIAATWHKAELFEKAQQEIAQRKQGEVRIRRQLDHLTALSAIDRVINSIFDLRVSLSEILHHVTNELGVDAADILILNPNSPILEYGAEFGFRTEAVRETRVRLGESLAGQVALERKLVRISNLQKEPNNGLLATLLKGEDFVCYYGLPIIIKGQVKGVLEIFDRASLEPDKEWFDFLQNLAGQVAIAMEISTLFESLQRSNSDLFLAYDATIEGWSHALDLRDKETEGHTQRVASLTVKLARLFSLTEAELAQVRWGALLHDIGKMGVSDGILHKPGPLTDEEWVEMKKHPLFAFEMLSPIRYLRLALDIPYCHHEKWDGSGYPRGLKGSQIPLVARIFSVVDVWDALNSDRPYRRAWSNEKIFQYLHSSSGTCFDPQVVDAFMQISDDILSLPQVD